jgi:hypothetical protein
MSVTPTPTLRNSPDTIEEALAAIRDWASLTEADMPDDWTPPTVAHIAEATALVRTAHERYGLVPYFLVPYQCEWRVGGKEFEADFDGGDKLSYLIDHTPAIRRQENPAKYTVVKDVPLAAVIDALGEIAKG